MSRWDALVSRAYDVVILLVWVVAVVYTLREARNGGGGQ